MQGNIALGIAADPAAGQCGAGLIEQTLYLLKMKTWHNILDQEVGQTGKQIMLRYR